MNDDIISAIGQDAQCVRCLRRFTAHAKQIFSIQRRKREEEFVIPLAAADLVRFGEIAWIPQEKIGIFLIGKIEANL